MEAVLELLKIDLMRLNRLRAVNPRHFKERFEGAGKHVGRALKWSWKLALFSTKFAGDVEDLAEVSFALGNAMVAGQVAWGNARSVIAKQTSNQRQLLGKGSE